MKGATHAKHDTGASDAPPTTKPSWQQEEALDDRKDAFPTTAGRRQLQPQAAEIEKEPEMLGALAGSPELPFL